MKAMKIVALGDSLVGDYGDGRGGLTRALAQKMSGAVSIDGYGVRGSTAARWRDELATEALHHVDVDGAVVVVSLGVNDLAGGASPALVAAKLDELAARLSRAGAARLVWVAATNDPRWSERLAAVGERLRGGWTVARLNWAGPTTLHPSVAQHAAANDPLVAELLRQPGQSRAMGAALLGVGAVVGLGAALLRWGR